MKNGKVLELNTTILKTPLADIEIIDENGRNIPFDIMEIPDSPHYVYIDNNPNLAEEVVDYDECVIRIHTASLEIGGKYFVKSSNPLEWRDSDERLFTYGYTEGTQTFAISFPDPNDEYKISRWRKEGSKMVWYDFNVESDVGTAPVSFYLIDREQEYIYIAAAWIRNIRDHIHDYESATEVFTWII